MYCQYYNFPNVTSSIPTLVFTMNQQAFLRLQSRDLELFCCSGFTSESFNRAMAAATARTQRFMLIHGP
jgi:hypothetical protein